MSKFSIYLKNLIEDSGESISFIARSIEAERTSIHKALTDERILSYKVVQALARHFNLPVDKKKEFSDCMIFCCRARNLMKTARPSAAC